MKTRASLILLSICMLVSSAAYAQYDPQPPPPPPGGGYGGAPPPPPPQQGYIPPPPPARDGFMIGFSLGAGSQQFDCDFCTGNSQEGFAFDFSIGGFLNPNLALMYDVSAVMNFEDDGFGDQVIFTNAANVFAAQFWVAPQIWIKGGIGFGQFQITGEFVDAESELGFALTGAAGYEIIQSNNFAFDVQLRIAPVVYENDAGDRLTITNASIMGGLNWY